MRRLLILALPALWACSDDPVEPVQSTGTIIVEVLDQDEDPVPTVPVSIWTPEFTKFTGVTGPDGTYSQVVPAPWYYRVLAEVHNHREESCFVNEGATAKCTTDIVTFVPQRPIFHSGERVGTDSIIELVWNTPWDGGLGGNGLEGFMIEARVGRGPRDTIVVNNGSGTDTTFTYTGVMDSVEYRFWVSAINYRGVGTARRKTVQAVDTTGSQRLD